MKPKLLKAAFYAVIGVAVVAGLAPFIPAAFLRSRVEAALSAGLGRPIEIGDIRFTFFPAGPVPGPGFALANVTIHEDQRAGIEPFAYMQELGASIRILSLLAGRLELSGINLGDASINLVKTPSGEWNFQYLLDGVKDAPIPAFRMRGGRVNFKFGDTKSAFFFKAADIDIAPGVTGSTLRFSGEPSRSDRTKQDFGRFFIRGTSSAAGKLDLILELQRSSLEESLRLMDPQGFGVHGILAINGRAQGTPDRLELTATAAIGDIHRYDLLPQEGQAWTVPLRGTLNLRDERVDIESTEPQAAVSLKFHAQDYLSQPAWSASAEFRVMPLATLFAVARHMGATLPSDLAVEGVVSGIATRDQTAGMTGQLKVSDASLTLPGNDPLKAASVTLDLRDGAVHLVPATIVLSPTQAAQMEGQVALASPHALDLRITTRGLSIAAMRSFGLPQIPVFGESPQGQWSGWARFHDSKWSSESQIKDARILLDGFAAPLEINSAAVSLAANRLAVTRLTAKLGEIPLTGSYEVRPTQPARFTLSIPDLPAAELDRLLALTLSRAAQGILDRTLRRAANLPGWLQSRRAEGTLSIETASAGDWRARDLKARVQWDAGTVRFTQATAQLDSATFNGTLEVDLSAPLAKHRLTGALTGIPYRGGTLDLAGSVEAEGSGAQLLQSARAEGSAKGRSIAFAPDAEFRTFSAQFQMGVAPRWKLTNVETPQGQGTGATQDDGQLVLTLGTARLAAPLFPPRAAK